MKRQIILGNRKLSYILKQSRRARRLRLTVYRGGELVVTMPGGLDLARAENFILEKTRWVISKIDYFKKFGAGPAVKVKKGDFKKYKDMALALAEERICHFNAFYGFKFNKIAIKNQKTLWGSCSQKGNLNFNYKIALLPPSLADYVIAHELCHLGALNHSRRFWKLVARVIPDFRVRRKEIKNVF